MLIACLVHASCISLPFYRRMEVIVSIGQYPMTTPRTDRQKIASSGSATARSSTPAIISIIDLSDLAIWQSKAEQTDRSPGQSGAE